jgi:hypothetical protein
VQEQAQVQSQGSPDVAAAQSAEAQQLARHALFLEPIGGALPIGAHAYFAEQQRSLFGDALGALCPYTSSPCATGHSADGSHAEPAPVPEPSSHPHTHAVCVVRRTGGRLDCSVELVQCSGRRAAEECGVEPGVIDKFQIALLACPEFTSVDRRAALLAVSALLGEERGPGSAHSTRGDGDCDQSGPWQARGQALGLQIAEEYAIATAQAHTEAEAAAEGGTGTGTEALSGAEQQDTSTATPACHARRAWAVLERALLLAGAADPASAPAAASLEASDGPAGVGVGRLLGVLGADAYVRAFRCKHASERLRLCDMR